MKKYLSLFLCLILLFGLLPLTAPARAVSSGDWEYDVYDEEAVVTGYTGAGGKVSIPSTLGGKPVKTIGSYVFEDCKGLTSVTVPSSVSYIAIAAFSACADLQSIRVDSENADYTSIDGVLFSKDKTQLCACPCGRSGEYSIPGTVIWIDNYAFGNCRNLTNLTIPRSVTTIDSGAFRGCIGLQNIRVESGNADFSSTDGVLFSKDKTELCAYPCGRSGEYSIPNTVIDIDSNAFSSCSSLTSVTIPDSVTWIGNFAFENCSSLTSVTIPESVTAISVGAFCGCSSLQSIRVENGNTKYTSIDGVLFSKDRTYLYAYPGGKTGRYTIPDTVTEIGSYAFFGCACLTGVTIPRSVILLSDNAFHGCASLTTMTIPDSIIAIYVSTFADCAALTGVTIPQSVTRIGWGAFSGCASLTDVYFIGSAEEWGRVCIDNDNDPLVSASIHYTGPLAVSGIKANKTTATTGEAITWTASAIGGSGSLQYYFAIYKDGSQVAKRGYGTAKAFSYTPTEPGTYKARVYVKDAFETKVNKLSTGVTVTVGVPVITTQPSAKTVSAGETATFKIAASGTELAYQWQYSKDGGTTWYSKSGATSASCSVTAKTSYDGFLYRCKVKNAGGTVYSDSAKLSVTAAAAPVISSVKAGFTSAYAGEKITWTAAASGGSGTLKYYFILYKDGTKIKTRSYSTTRTFSYTPTEAGSYKVKVYVKDADGTKSYKVSGKVAVTLGPPAIISVKAGKANSVTGEEITWTAAAVGSEQPLKYYFVLYKDGAKIKTRTYRTANTFSYTPAEGGTYKVRVYVKDAEGTKVSKLGSKVTVTDPAPIFAGDYFISILSINTQTSQTTVFDPTTHTNVPVKAPANAVHGDLVTFCHVGDEYTVKLCPRLTGVYIEQIGQDPEGNTTYNNGSIYPSKAENLISVYLPLNVTRLAGTVSQLKLGSKYTLYFDEQGGCIGFSD